MNVLSAMKSQWTLFCICVATCVCVTSVHCNSGGDGAVVSAPSVVLLSGTLYALTGRDGNPLLRGPPVIPAHTKGVKVLSV